MVFSSQTRCKSNQKQPSHPSRKIGNERCFTRDNKESLALHPPAVLWGNSNDVIIPLYSRFQVILKEVVHLTPACEGRVASSSLSQLPTDLQACLGIGTKRDHPRCYTYRAPIGGGSFRGAAQS